jgi:hypothetical protein
MAGAAARGGFRTSVLLHRPPGRSWGSLGRAVHETAPRKLRELRFYIGREQHRITYYMAAGRRIILLTVFRKTRGRERREIDRAERAMERCIAEGHTAEE